MRQRRRLELIKDYNLEIHYHLGKANIVANALRELLPQSDGRSHTPKLSQEMEELQLKILPNRMLNELQVQYNLEDRFCKA